ncbi:unnamed protein product [Cuscuta europaea]|uniref:Replication protein A 70 kDa DNA-binding subunit B/D first OB fold domain-containing protein n=1 Tax=Cuscuta europaea TaxID=41803 RepID=A0A9P0ZJF2_CUSEU|nr:unnamed protein product [Cuscuta europaea]
MPPIKKVLSEVTLDLEKNAALLLCVTRKWTIPFKNNTGLKVCELVLVDEEGKHIQATIPLQLIPMLEGKLEEGSLYAMVNFSVKENQGKWRPTSHPFRLCFTENTKILDQMIEKHPAFQKNIYKLTEFSDIINYPDVETPDLLDVIGACHIKDNLFKSDDEGTSWCRFQINNLQNIKIWCTLWGDYSAQFLRFLEVPRQNPFIVLLQLENMIMTI